MSLVVISCLFGHSSFLFTNFVCILEGLVSYFAHFVSFWSLMSLFGSFFVCVFFTCFLSLLGPFLSLFGHSAAQEGAPGRPVH